MAETVDNTCTILLQQIHNVSALIGRENADPAGAIGVPLLEEDDAQLGLMVVARDWAGELISGQTKTGQIVVCCMKLLDCSAKFAPPFKLSRTRETLVRVHAAMVGIGIHWPSVNCQVNLKLNDY